MLDLPLAALTKEDLFTYGFLFFFFVLPMIRSVLDKAQKARGTTGRGEEDDVPFEDDTEDDYSGGADWERLLRGEYEISPAKPKVPEPVRAQGTVVQKPGSGPTPIYGGSGSTLGSLPAMGSLGEEPSAERSFESLRSSEASHPNVALHESVTHLAEFHSSSEDMSTQGENLSKDFASLKDLTQIPATHSHRPRSKSALDWRLAIRTREILGAPVSLRGESAEIPGFR